MLGELFGLAAGHVFGVFIETPGFLVVKEGPPRVVGPGNAWRDLEVALLVFGYVHEALVVRDNSVSLDLRILVEVVLEFGLDLDVLGKFGRFHLSGSFLSWRGTSPLLTPPV